MLQAPSKANNHFMLEIFSGTFGEYNARIFVIFIGESVISHSVNCKMGTTLRCEFISYLSFLFFVGNQSCTEGFFGVFSLHQYPHTLRKKRSFPLRISSVNMTISCGFGHKYWRMENLMVNLMENLIFCALI